MSPSLLSEEDIAHLNKAFDFIGRAFANHANQIADIMRTCFPIVSEIHRAEVKRVRTAYRRKKGKRW